MLNVTRPVIAAAVIAVAGFSIASAAPAMRYQGAPTYSSPYFRYPHAPPRPPVPRYQITPFDVMRAQAAGWQRVAAKAPFGMNGAGTELLMTDGSVMISDNTNNWYRLTPDQNGNYVRGTWSKAASLPSNYGPLYFASAVLADGKLIINGGEYNFFHGAETNQGSIYDPVADTWTPVSPPNGWGSIGDASSVVLSNDSYMIGNCCYSTQAILNESLMTWTITGMGKADRNSEEGWTLLPNGKVLTVDVWLSQASELYNPKTGSWSSAGTLPVNLITGSEIGPGVLRPDGTVFVAGATQHTAIYSTKTRAWSAGPDFPVVGGQQVDVADGPATLLTDGEVLLAASPGLYNSPATFLVFNGTQLTVVPGPPNSPNNSSYNIRLLMLPTGQVLQTDASNDVEIYTPAVKTDRRIAPVISSVPTTLTHGNTFTITGTLFNGVSQANMYGDDAQQASNYPLVRITNTATRHVFYARTHDHSFMGVASKAVVSTMFDVPANIELGASTLEVVVNGIHSLPVSVTIN